MALSISRSSRSSSISSQAFQSIVQGQFCVLRCPFALKTIINHCVHCVRITQHVDYAIMADLPDCRLPSANHFPFQPTGLDFVCPFLIKDKGQFERRFCLLVTCLVTRADHIETCADLNTETP